MPTPNIASLKQALAISEQIQSLQSKLASVLGGSKSAPSSTTVSSAPKAGRGGKRKMSAATIAKMRASQQARWAKKKGPVAAPAAPAAAKPAKAGKRKKRTLSPEGRARIIAAQKKRWAKKK